MAQVINTNIASLTAQRNLNASQSQLQQSLERLSSGMRINSAKDDAAGLAISERFSAQIRGLDQATRNANDGISFAQTAEGALAEIGNITQRIRELAVQSSNDTNSASDRQALNDEVQQLIKEVSRIAGSTQFNGQNVLDGSKSELSFQVGANQGQTIEVEGVDARTSKLGALTRDAGSLGSGATVFENNGFTDGVMLTAATAGGAVMGSLTAGSAALEIGGKEYSYATNAASADVENGKFHTAEDLVNAINLRTEETGITAVQNSSLSVNLGNYDATVTSAAVTLTINGEDFSAGTAGDYATADELVSAINDKQLQTGGVIASLNDNNEIELTSQGGASIDLGIDNSDTMFDGLNAGDLGTTTFEAGFKLQANGAEDITVTGAAGDNFGSQFTDATDVGASTLQEISVASREDAVAAIETADYVLGQVNGLRAELGAVQNRFESTISNLSVSSENLAAARSRIQDADFASETAALTKAQILQQAGTSVLAQANQAPNNVLSLLQ